MKTKAEALRVRAAAGESFSKLQDEAYLFAGLKTKPPNPTLGKVRRSNLPPSHIVVMDLKPGTALSVDILGEARAAAVVPQPLYDPRNLRLLS